MLEEFQEHEYICENCKGKFFLKFPPLLSALCGNCALKKTKNFIHSEHFSPELLKNVCNIRPQDIDDLSQGDTLEILEKKIVQLENELSLVKEKSKQSEEKLNQITQKQQEKKV